VFDIKTLIFAEFVGKRNAMPASFHKTGCIHPSPLVRGEPVEPLRESAVGP
jgi:hypothetical protein